MPDRMTDDPSPSYAELFQQREDARAQVERLRARIAELEATPVDWDAQRRRADELEATAERLRRERIVERANASTDLYTEQSIANGWADELLRANAGVERLRAELAEARDECDRARALAGVRGDLLDETRQKLARAQATGRELQDELAEAIRERDLAVAHDRQPYPTAWAYEQACEALEKHRKCAEQAEAERDAAHAAIARVRELRDWLATGETMDIADRITRALRAPESPTDAPTAPTRPDDTHQPHNGQENA